MPVIEGTQRLKTVEVVYDFAVDAGAVGQITLRGAPGDSMGNTVPVGAVVTGGFIDVTVAPAGTGTVALDLEGAGDIRAAATIASTGRISIVPAGTGATAVKTTAVRSLKMTIGTAVLTTGTFRVVLFYK
jgi:hypothetical protein